MNPDSKWYAKHHLFPGYRNRISDGMQCGNGTRNPAHTVHTPSQHSTLWSGDHKIRNAHILLRTVRTVKMCAIQIL